MKKGVALSLGSSLSFTLSLTLNSCQQAALPAERPETAAHQLALALSRDQNLPTDQLSAQGLVAVNYLWDRSRLSVCWINPEASAQQEKQWIQRAITRVWQRNSQVYFVNWGTCSGNEDVRIQVGASEWPRSDIGTVSNKNKPGPSMFLNTSFNIADFANCRSSEMQRRACIEFTAIHEFGHALGFMHEQARMDTPPDCKKPDSWTQPSDAIALGPWDKESVMSACAMLWNNSGRLSNTDRVMLNTYYKTPIRHSDHSFDAFFYLDLYPFVSPEGDQVAAEQHWWSTGRFIGLRGSMQLDPIFYLSIHPDLINAYGANNYSAAIQHWKSYGIYEGRRGSLEVDVNDYLNRYPDLKQAYGNRYADALNHWAAYGIGEKRQASSDFNVLNYLYRYYDIFDAYGYADTEYAMTGDPFLALTHWVKWGKSEGRDGR